MTMRRLSLESQWKGGGKEVGGGAQRRSKEWFALEMSITVSLSNGKVMKQTD